MYHGLRKALNTGVKSAVAKDGRVSAAEEAHVRLDKSIESLAWALDNCEASWKQQAAFLQYVPVIATDCYSATDAAASQVVRAATDAAAQLATAAAAPTLAPVRAELNALRERLQRLDALRSEWMRALSDQKYYDDKYLKLLKSADPEKEREKDREKREEKEKRGLLKKAQAADELHALSNKLADEFDAVHREKLAVADKVLLAVLGTQSANARRADTAAVREIALGARFGARNVPQPAREENLLGVLTGASERRRSSSDFGLSASASEPSLHVAQQAASAPAPAPASAAKSTTALPPPDYAPPRPNYAPPRSMGAPVSITPPLTDRPYQSPPNPPQPHTRPTSAPSSHSWDSRTPSRRVDGLDFDFSAFRISDTGGASASAPSAPPPPPRSPGAESVYSAVNGVEMEFVTHPPLH